MTHPTTPTSPRRLEPAETTRSATSRGPTAPLAAASTASVDLLVDASAYLEAARRAAWPTSPPRPTLVDALRAKLGSDWTWTPDGASATVEARHAGGLWVVLSTLSDATDDAHVQRMADALLDAVEDHVKGQVLVVTTYAEGGRLVGVEVERVTEGGTAWTVGPAPAAGRREVAVSATGMGPGTWPKVGDRIRFTATHPDEGETGVVVRIDTLCGPPRPRVCLDGGEGAERYIIAPSQWEPA